MRFDVVVDASSIEADIKGLSHQTADFVEEYIVFVFFGISEHDNSSEWKAGRKVVCFFLNSVKIIFTGNLYRARVFLVIALDNKP